MEYEPAIAVCARLRGTVLVVDSLALVRRFAAVSTRESVCWDFIKDTRLHAAWPTPPTLALKQERELDRCSCQKKASRLMSQGQPSFGDTHETRQNQSMDGPVPM